MLKTPDGMLIVGYPHRTNEAHIANVNTGAWARWTGHDIQAMVQHNGKAYFGSSTGYVSQIEGAGADLGQTYVCRLSMLPDPMGSPGRYKHMEMGRATFRALIPFKAKISVARSYSRDFPSPPSVEPDATVAALWDVGVWDVSRWDDSPDSEQRDTRTTKWRSLNRAAESFGAQVQITCSGQRLPDAELVSFDVLFKVGNPVV
jgi:hypothetical protein